MYIKDRSKCPTFQAEVYVTYNMDITHNVKITDVPECAEDIAWYASQGEHWPDPILPGTDDCPPMDLSPNLFQLIASQWICRQTEDTGGGYTERNDSDVHGAIRSTVVR